MLCRHCCARKANRPRGLCWHCYYTPGVRDLYAPSGKHGKWGVRCWSAREVTPPSPDEPTATPPGSPERAAVMAERAAAGRGLWHEGDVRRDLR